MESNLLTEETGNCNIGFVLGLKWGRVRSDGLRFDYLFVNG
jgi:hypothetical protein